MLASILALSLSAAPVPGTERLTLTADSLLYDSARHVTNADGHAHFVTEGAAVDADRMVYDENLQAVTAVGHVVARIAQQGLIGIVADIATLRLDGQQVKEVYLVDGRAIAKKDTSAEALLEANTAAAVEKVGHTQALLEGNRLVREGRAWSSDRISLVPCECDFSKPSWSIEASHATIDTEAERVAVTMPVVHIKNVPVLWFPWLSLPLTNRQSGILFTRPTYSALNGFGIEQPVFVTLGRSADVTLTPGYFVGAPPDAQGNQTPFGVAGPRLQTEFRYVPSSRATGRAFVGLLYDTKVARDPVNAGLVDPNKTPRGLRGELAWAHQQDFDFGFGTRVDLNAYSDGYYSRDVTTDVLAATNGFLRSGASLFHRSDSHLVSVDLALRQDLQLGYSWFGRSPLPNDSRFGPGTLQRWPAVTAVVPLHSIAGPFAFDFAGEFVRLAPLFSKSGDEGSNAGEGSLFGTDNTELTYQCVRSRLLGTTHSSCPLDPTATGAGDRIWQVGEREARDRAMLFPRLQVQGSLGGTVALGAWVGWRQSVWLGEASARSWQRGTLLFDGHAETEISRQFNGLRHSIQPLVRVRGLPLVIRGSTDGADPVPYDDVDAAVPRNSTARVQGAIEVRQRLSGPKGSLQLDLGQGVDLLAPERAGVTLAESYGRLGATFGIFRAQALARVDPVLARLTRLSASLGLDDGRKGLTASYENLLDDGTNRSRAPVDLLFGTPVPNWPFASRAQLLSGGAYYNFGSVALRYDLLLLDRVWNPLAPQTSTALSFAQHQVTVSLTPACDCWRVDLYAVQRLSPGTWPLPLTNPDFGASVTVSRFGSIGTR